MGAPPIDTAQRPLVLIWELTQACELACKHCRADAKSHRHPDELSTAEGKQLLDTISSQWENQLVVLSGGDPLFRDDVVELVDYGTDRGLQMTLTPSGTESLDVETIQALREAGMRRLALSIDGGSASRHDSFRQESGSFANTLAVAKSARNQNIPLQINTTVCAETVDELADIRTLVAELDAVLWSVFFLVPVGRGSTLTSITPERCEELMQWLRSVADTASFRIKTTEAPHYRRVKTQERLEHDEPSISDNETDRPPGIIAGDGFAFINHVGDVYPSGFLPIAAGNVRNQSIIDIYQHSELFQSLRDRDSLGGKCGVCPYRAICGGSRSRAYALTGDPFASDPLCAYVPAEYDGPVPELSEMAEMG